MTSLNKAQLLDIRHKLEIFMADGVKVFSVGRDVADRVGLAERVCFSRIVWNLLTRECF